MVVTTSSFGNEDRGAKKGRKGDGNTAGTGKAGHTPQFPIDGMPGMPQDTGIENLGTPDPYMMDTRDQSGAHGPHSGGPGAGSTKAKGNSAGLAPRDVGNPEGTGAQGSPPAVNSVTQGTNPTSTGAGTGTVLKGGRGASYTK